MKRAQAPSHSFLALICRGIGRRVEEELESCDFADASLKIEIRGEVESEEVVFNPCGVCPDWRDGGLEMVRRVAREGSILARIFFRRARRGTNWTGFSSTSFIPACIQSWWVLVSALAVRPTTGTLEFSSRSFWSSIMVFVAS